MTFPSDNLTVELFIGGELVDVTATSDVRGISGININRGRNANSGRATPAMADFTLSGADYVNKNPLSPYYGLLGINTPCRVSLAMGLSTGDGADFGDGFDRTESNTWANDWSQSGTSSTATDWTVSSSQAHHYVDSAGEERYSYQESVTSVSGTATVNVLIPQATGGELRVDLLFRGTAASAGNHIFLRASATTGNAINLMWVDRDSGQISTSVNSGISHTGTGQPFTIKARVAGPYLQAKAWVTSGSEPADWQITRVSAFASEAGWVGIRSSRQSGNTNTANPQFNYASYTFTKEIGMFHGEIPAWKPVADKTGHDVTVPVQGAGYLRRLTSGIQKPINSALYTAVTKASTTIIRAYWPLEDRNTATTGTSPTQGVLPMAAPGVSRFTGAGGIPIPPAGAPRFHAGTLIDGSDYTITLQSGGVLRGVVPAVLGDAEWSISWTMRFDANAEIDPATSLDVLSWVTTGTYASFVVNVTSTSVTVFHGSPTSFDGSASYTINLYDGTPHTYSYTGRTSGGDVVALFYIDGTLRDTADNFGSPMTGSSGTLSSVIVNHGEHQSLDMPAAFGHVLVTADESFFTTISYDEAALGWAGETATERFSRLCEENNIIYETQGTGLAMGAQTVDTLFNLLSQCEETDRGIFTEPREYLGLKYIAKDALYSLSSQLELDYASQHLSSQLQPITDDRALANDVTAENPVTGDLARYIITEGPNNASEPSADDPEAVGQYDILVPVNAFDTDDLMLTAEWIAYLGTDSTERFAAVVLELAREQFQNDEALLYNALTLDEGELFSIGNAPAWASPYVITQLVRGYRCAIENSGSARGVTFTINSSPGQFYAHIGVYDAATSLYDSGSSTLSVGIDSDDTSVSVATSNAADLWITGSVDFDIEIGGEVMSVSNVTGSTSPQTFTVTRSVNGIVKSHSSGIPVHVYQQTRYGL